MGLPVREETRSGYENRAYMVPAKGCLVNLCEGKSTALIRVLNVNEVIVEVVVRILGSSAVAHTNDRRREGERRFSTIGWCSQRKSMFSRSIGYIQ
jgi:hypothetical protein